MTQIYFAVSNSGDHINHDTFSRWNWVERPLNILCPFEPKGSLDHWVNRKYETPGVNTILDSGAFSAWKSGTNINFEDLMEEASDREPKWDEVAALDVIGSASESLYNAVEMQKHNLPVIPVFHYGEDWGYLQAYKDRFNGRVGLGGIATGISIVKKRRWLEQCFAKAYPARFHGFGVASRDLLMDFPFASADTASWHAGLRFGRSVAAPDLKMPRKSSLDGGEYENSAYDLRAELLYYLEMADEVTERWKSEMQQFEVPVG